MKLRGMRTRDAERKRHSPSTFRQQKQRLEQGRGIVSTMMCRSIQKRHWPEEPKRKEGTCREMTSATGNGREEEARQWSRRTRKELAADTLARVGAKSPRVTLQGLSIPAAIFSKFTWFNKLAYLGYSQLLDARPLLHGGFHPSEANLPRTKHRRTQRDTRRLSGRFYSDARRTPAAHNVPRSVETMLRTSLDACPGTSECIRYTRNKHK